MKMIFSSAEPLVQKRKEPW